MERFIYLFFHNWRYWLDTALAVITLFVACVFALKGVDKIVIVAAILTIVWCLNKLFKIAALSIAFFKALEKAHNEKRTLTNAEKIEYCCNTHPLNAVIVEYCERLDAGDRWVLFLMFKVAWRVAYAGFIRFKSAIAALSWGNTVLTNKVLKQNFQVILKILKKRAITHKSVLNFKKTQLLSNDHFREVCVTKNDDAPALKAVIKKAHELEYKRLMLLKGTGIQLGRTAQDDLEQVPQGWRVIRTSITGGGYNWKSLQPSAAIVSKTIRDNTVIANVMFPDCAESHDPRFHIPRCYRIQFKKQARFFQLFGLAFDTELGESGPFGPINMVFEGAPSRDTMDKLVGCAARFYKHPGFVVHDPARDWGSLELIRIYGATDDQNVQHYFTIMSANYNAIRSAGEQRGIIVPKPLPILKPSNVISSKDFLLESYRRTNPISVERRVFGLSPLPKLPQRLTEALQFTQQIHMGDNTMKECVTIKLTPAQKDDFLFKTIPLKSFDNYHRRTLRAGRPNAGLLLHSREFFAANPVKTKL